MWVKVLWHYVRLCGVMCEEGTLVHSQHMHVSQVKRQNM